MSQRDALTEVLFLLFGAGVFRKKHNYRRSKIEYEQFIGAGTAAFICLKFLITIKRQRLHVGRV